MNSEQSFPIGKCYLTTTIALLLGANLCVSSANAQMRPGYAGDAACVSCHAQQSRGYEHTSHHLTSQLANRDSILGSFHNGSNILNIADPATSPAEPALYFKMEEKGGRFYQTASTAWAPT